MQQKVLLRIVRETGVAFGDEQHIIYVNGACRDKNGNALEKLMADFFCVDPDELQESPLKDRVKELKQCEKGVTSMSGVLDQFMEKLCAEREEKGKLKTLCELVFDRVLPVEDAARRSKLSRLDFLREMQERYPNWEE